MAVFVNNQPLALLKDQSQIFGPYDLNDAALSVRIGATCSAWADNIVLGKIAEVFQAILEVSRDGGGVWNVEGSFGATGDVRSVGAEANVRIGLYPGIGRKIRVTVISRVAALSTFLKIENSLTVGTPGQTSGSGSSASVAVDVGSGSERAIFAFNCRENFATLDSFTYNSVALTDITTTTGTPYVTARYSVNPASGSHTLASDWSGSGSCCFGMCGVPFAGVDQTTAFDGLQTDATLSASALSIAVTSATGNYVLNGAIMVGYSGPQNITPDASQTAAADWDTMGGNNTAGGVAYEAGAASVTLTWTGATGPAGGRQAGFNVRASGGAAATWGPLLSLKNNRLVVA